MTKQDFRDWQRHPVTEAMFAELKVREQFCIEQLINGEGDKPNDYYRGLIAAYRDVYQIDIEESQE